jgi:hypothetical protein
MYETYSRNTNIPNYLCTDVFWDDPTYQISFTKNMEIGSSQCVCIDASILLTKKMYYNYHMTTCIPTIEW